MSDQLYREVILDHYKNPRGHGVIEDADAEAEGFNPLCGDEVSIYVSFADDDETIEDVKFSGRGCAISQAATSMLVDMAKGRKATELAEMPKDELLEEIGIPLSPIRLKCALLGLGVPYGGFRREAVGDDEVFEGHGPALVVRPLGVGCDRAYEPGAELVPGQSQPIHERDGHRHGAGLPGCREDKLSVVSRQRAVAVHQRNLVG